MTAPPSLRDKNLIQCHYADTRLTQLYLVTLFNNLKGAGDELLS